MNPASDEFYLRINEPPFLFLTDEEADEIVCPLHCQRHNGAVVVVRGQKCATYRELHNEVGAAFQFPSYYGENWDAMDECLCDLEWMPAEWYLVHVRSADAILPADDEGFMILFDNLNTACCHWGRTQKIPFNLLVSGAESGSQRCRRALGLGDPD